MDTGSTTARAALRAAGMLFGPRSIPPIPTDVRGILVVRQHDQLGDMLCVSTTLRALRDAYPGAPITLVASPVNRDIMLHHPRLDRVLLYDKRTIRSSAGASLRFRAELRSRPYDLAIVPSTVSISVTSGVIARLSGAPVRIGPGRLEHRDNPASFLFTHPVDLDWSAEPARHQMLRNADILRPLGIRIPAAAAEIGLSDAELERGRLLLAPLRAAHRVIVGVHPGAAKPGNRWPVERFVEVARRLHDEFGSGLVVTIGPNDRAEHERLKGLLDVPHLFVAGEPIRSVAGVIASLDAFISNDTGPMHIAGALTTPLLALFGPTDPKVWAPPGEKNGWIAAADRKVDSITTAEVLAAARRMLAGIRRSD